MTETLPENILSRAFDLYYECIKGINKGVFPFNVSITDNEPRLIVNTLMKKMSDSGYKINLVTQTTTESDSFYNHTYEVSQIFLSIDQIRSKL